MEEPLAPDDLRVDVKLEHKAQKRRVGLRLKRLSCSNLREERETQVFHCVSLQTNVEEQV